MVRHLFWSYHSFLPNRGRVIHFIEVFSTSIPNNIENTHWSTILYVKNYFMTLMIDGKFYKPYFCWRQNPVLIDVIKAEHPAEFVFKAETARQSYQSKDVYKSIISVIS